MPVITPAHLHILLNHIPVIGVPLVALLLCWGIFRRHDVVIRAALYGAILMAGASFLADQTGDRAKDNIKNEVWATKEAIEEHEDAADIANIAALVTGAAALVLLVLARGGKPVHRLGVMVVLVATVVTGAAMARTGWEGGKIRHSEFQSTTATTPGTTEDDS